MKLIVKNTSDLAAWFEQEPGPWYGNRQTMLDDRRTVERVIHSSELPVDYLMSMPSKGESEVESFDLDGFLMYH